MSNVAYSHGAVVRRESGAPVLVSDLIKPCAYSKPKIGDAHQVSLHDAGSECNLISRLIALACGLIIGPAFDLNLQGVTGVGRTAGVVLDVSVWHGSACVPTDFIVMDHLEVGVLLGRPWQAKAKYTAKEGKGYLQCTIEDFLTGTPVEFRAPLTMGSELKDRRMQEERLEEAKTMPSRIESLN